MDASSGMRSSISMAAVALLLLPMTSGGRSARSSIGGSVMGGSVSGGSVMGGSVMGGSVIFGLCCLIK